MNQWNKAYLDALEIPVWVPLNDQTEEKSAAAVEAESSAQTETPAEAESTTSVEQFQLLYGEKNAPFVFVVSDELSRDAVLKTLQQLQFAWQAWLDQPLFAALVQFVKADTAESFELETMGGQIIDCRSSEQPLEPPCISGPTFDLNAADKKAWWALLQRLH